MQFAVSNVREMATVPAEKYNKGLCNEFPEQLRQMKQGCRMQVSLFRKSL